MNSNNNFELNDDNEFIFSHEFLKDLVPSFNTLCMELQKAIRDKSKSN